MFDIAPTEFLLVVVVALVVIGPKDLPKAMRFVGKWMGKARGMARHFRAGMDTMMREAELEDLEKQWKAQNAEIMRQFPTAPNMTSSDRPKNKDDAVTAPETMGENQADFDAAVQSGASTEKAGSDASHSENSETAVETHKVPPHSDKLP